MKLRRRIVAAAHREIRRLAAITTARAAETENRLAAVTFRPLTESETEAIVGADLLAQVAASAGALR
jgi:hypothetical protein